MILSLKLRERDEVHCILFLSCRSKVSAWCVMNSPYYFRNGVNQSSRPLSYLLLESFSMKTKPNSHIKKKRLIGSFWYFKNCQILIFMHTPNTFLLSIFTFYVISQYYFIASKRFYFNSHWLGLAKANYWWLLSFLLFLSKMKGVFFIHSQ